MTQEETPGSSDNDPFVIAVREYILATLTPLIPQGEQTGRFMFGLLRRALRTASREDLEQVVLHCVAFTDGLRENGFISDELAREAHEYLQPDGIASAIGGTPLQGQGTTDWPDEEREINLGEASDSSVPSDDDGGDEGGVGTSTDTGGGHEAEVAGDEDPNGEVGAEALQEDGPG